VRILLDYRPALVERTGVGEYVHQLAAALASNRRPDESVTLFSASWKVRLARPVPGLDTLDWRIPGQLLHWLWHRRRWPPVDRRRAFDVVQAAHPLLVPARGAAQVVTIADLDFLDHPERSHREIRRDYPDLAGAHARAADHVVTISRATAADIERRLGVPARRITVCTPGAPAWPARGEEPADGVILFLGTLEPRKNLDGLLAAYAALAARPAPLPRLVVAGRPAKDSSLTSRLHAAGLASRVDTPGYVPDADRVALYRRALVLVVPSHTEGFGMTALEAMTVGVPVIASNRGALPEVLGDAGRLVDPARPAELAEAMSGVLASRELRDRMREAGWRRAREFQWTASADRLREAWLAAHVARRERMA
jgi:glycosyltransferase involved in cell wall biosynthesis